MVLAARRIPKMDDSHLRSRPAPNDLVDKIPSRVNLGIQDGCYGPPSAERQVSPAQFFSACRREARLAGSAVGS
jgi:hypothetical protein